MSEQKITRQLIIDWLDDNYHFGDTESLIGGDDNKSFLQSGILDSLGFVSLVLYIENTCNVKIDRADLRPENFDSMGKIVLYVMALQGFNSP